MSYQVIKNIEIRLLSYVDDSDVFVETPVFVNFTNGEEKMIAVNLFDLPFLSKLTNVNNKLEIRNCINSIFTSIREHIKE